MAIDNWNVVDSIGYDPAQGRAALFIFDHLPWVPAEPHFEALGRKISTYLNFIQSGQLFEELAAPASTQITIRLIHKYEALSAVTHVLNGISADLKHIGVGFEPEHRP